MGGDGDGREREADERRFVLDAAKRLWLTDWTPPTRSMKQPTSGMPFPISETSAPRIVRPRLTSREPWRRASTRSPKLASAARL